MIKNLSPYYVTIPFVAPLSGLTCTEFTLQIFVWDGQKSTPPTSAVYETTIKNPTGSVGNSKFDIANLVSDAIVFTQQEGTGTQLINGNNQVWVKWSTFYKTTQPLDATTPSNINTKLSVKGYSYGFDGENQSTPTNKILLTADDFKVSRNSVFVLPINIDEPVYPAPTAILNSITEIVTGQFQYNFTINFDSNSSFFEIKSSTSAFWLSDGEDTTEFLIGTHTRTLVATPTTALTNFRIRFYYPITNIFVTSNVINLP